MESEPKQSHDALSSMLHLPIVSTRPYRATHLNQSLANYEVTVGPSTLSATVELIIKYKWINVVILYDGKNHDDDDDDDIFLMIMMLRKTLD